MAEAESSGLTDGCVAFIPSEEFSFAYVVHDAHTSNRIERTRTGRNMYAVRTSNARPLSPALMPISTGDKMFGETVMFDSFEREIWDPFLFAEADGTCVYELPEPTRIDRPVILLPGLGSFYYHFLFDVVGALLTVPQADWTNRLAIYTQAPHPGPVRPWQNEILSIIYAQQTHAYEGHGNHIFSDAIVCSYPSQNNAVAPEVVRRLRGHLALPDGRPDPNQRVFFTRTGSRAIAQEHHRAMVSLAEAYGFHCVDPTQLGVRDQRRLLHNCSVFMCEAGSGLANLLFLPEGAVVITLGTKITFKDYFCPIATALNLESHVVLSDVKRMFPRHQFLWSSFTPTFDSAALARCMSILGIEVSRQKSR